jgi:hypothetical protein
MNDAVLNDLTAHVAQATGSIPVSAARRQQIHEELLAHLLDLYDQELERLQDEWAAADRAKQRFGQADDLRGELATAVPWVERLILRICGKEGIMWRWLGMYVLGLVTVFVGMGFVLPAIQQLRSPTPIMPNDRFGIAVLFPFGVVVTLLGLALVGYNLLKGFRARRC